MKHILLGMALAGLAFGCKSQDAASVTDPYAATAPAADCCAEGTCEDAGGCKAMKEGCEMKAGCDEMKAGCQGEAAPKTCPVTGAVEN